MVYGTKYINISIGKHALVTTLNKQIKSLFFKTV